MRFIDAGHEARARSGRDAPAEGRFDSQQRARILAPGRPARPYEETKLCVMENGFVYSPIYMMTLP